MQRIQQQYIINNLKKKMVFITGPRQVGKTWLAKKISAIFPKSVYLNFDSAGDRKIIRQKAWLEDTRLLVLDELHKMKGWKNYLSSNGNMKYLNCLQHIRLLNRDDKICSLLLWFSPNIISGTIIVYKTNFKACCKN